MKTLLFAYDGSSCADAALLDLARAGLPEEMDAVVLSVAEVWLPPEVQEWDPAEAGRVSEAILRARAAAWKAVKQDSQALAERACQRLAKSHPKWRLEALARGESPASAIVRVASERGADLVVVGSHSQSPLQRFFLGSVSQKVTVDAPCSVRIARPRAHPDHRGGQLKVVAATDGSRHSLAAVEAIAARTWPADASFEVVTVVDTWLASAVSWPGGYAQQWVQPRDADPQEWIHRFVEHATDLLRKAGLNARAQFLEGDPKRMLLQYAEDVKADAIFLGARGREHGERLALGTLAAAVATRAHCSVEVIRA